MLVFSSAWTQPFFEKKKFRKFSLKIFCHYYQDIYVRTDLKTIFKYYKQLQDAIDKMQDSAFPLVDSLQIVNEINEVLGTRYTCR
ncbi:hypothetical protein NQ318_001640 [Aromia moschata]|uniref:Uncharacterized protein n=1 Tax=Aromia moschata TaxID=1265417 RepID=A0AAV8Y1D0_9CUCU|nr:hypothetical protein NQ318_001640 [Aromia moschata]